MDMAVEGKVWLWKKIGVCENRLTGPTHRQVKAPVYELVPNFHYTLPVASVFMAENDETVLGKREREEDAGKDESMNSMGGDDSSDDEVGPMPLPAGAQGAAKKKRKGMLPLNL